MENNYGPLFRATRFLVRLFYPKYKIDITNEINTPIIYISHHQNLFGPFISLLWFPTFLRTWMLHVFLNQKACYRQYARYTFSERFGWNKYIAKVVAYPISFFISSLMKSARGIPVHRNSKKVIHTFQESISTLQNGESIIIFPDVDYTNNSSAMKEMYEGFLNIEKFFYKKTGQHIHFIPLYVSREKRLIKAGTPIQFQGELEFKVERKNVCDQIQRGLNQLAKACGD